MRLYLILINLSVFKDFCEFQIHLFSDFYVDFADLVKV